MKPLAVSVGNDDWITLCWLLQDEYANFSQAASVGVHGYVLVYSIGLRTSFEKLKLINEKLVNMLGSKPPRVLVGSMSDLEKARQVVQFSSWSMKCGGCGVDSQHMCVFCREVTVEEGQMLASSWECPFVECSAKDNENISTFVASLRLCSLCGNMYGSCNAVSTHLCTYADEVFTYLIKEIERDSGLLEESDESQCTIL